MISYIEATSLSDSLKTVIDTTFENLYHAIIIDKYGTIVHINDNYSDYLGLKRKVIIGTKVEDIIPGTKLYETLETGLPTFDDLFKFQDGRSLVYSRIPIKNQYGEILGVVSISSINSASTINALYKEINRLEITNKVLTRQLNGLTEAPSVFDNIVGESHKIMEIKRILSKVINSKMPILITGETGCGKEVFATAIHNASASKEAPFIKINCAAIPRELFESELFGYEAGTFSGAIKGGKPGKFELANGGTILLDEIGSLPMEMQSKLLRVLQEYEVVRIGSVKHIPLSLRVICCCNEDLYRLTKEKKFREDLYFRINVMEIEIPPLRDRLEDLPILCKSLIERVNTKHKLNVSGMSESAVEYLSDYAWPGNIRELEHVIERACVIANNRFIEKDDFLFMEKRKSHNRFSLSSQFGTNFFRNKGIAEKELIKEALSVCKCNKTAAAKQLGISRSLLYEKIKKYQI